MPEVLALFGGLAQKISSEIHGLMEHRSHGLLEDIIRRARTLATRVGRALLQVVKGLKERLLKQCEQKDQHPTTEKNSREP